ncbi:MAG: anhydro-N-acetylmuramic acid kinase [Acidobacteriaceae bacterium]
MNSPQPKAILVAGVMSGTSADGIDVAICRISPALRSETTPRLKLLGHRAFPYDKKLRATILGIAAGNKTTAAELNQLSWRLGDLYANCIATTAREFNLKPQLAAIHGQTVYHQATAAEFLGAPIRCTSQIGEPALIAERLRIPVVSDFRPADLAAEGQGAPLVPMLDFCLFRHATRNRLLLNLGGIANVTALPAACAADCVLAFDTGPANILIDLLMQQLYNRRCDKNGAIAATGRILTPVLDRLLITPYFSAPAPKSCGREEFGGAFAHHLLALCTRAKARNQDVIATATALTSATILDAYRRIAWPHLGQNAPLAQATDLIAAGGGTKNLTLMRALTEGFTQLGVKVSTTTASGIPVEAKEAAAFALLGWLTWHHLPGNIPTATGASHANILGKVTFV